MKIIISLTDSDEPLRVTDMYHNDYTLNVGSKLCLEIDHGDVFLFDKLGKSDNLTPGVKKIVTEAVESIVKGDKNEMS